MATNVITIDGPTSSGKNSVGFLLAQKLGYQYIDSGSIYRAGCILILKNNIPIEETEKVVEVFDNLDVRVENNQNTFRFFLNGQDVTNKLHNREVTRVASIIAAIGQVREKTKLIQHKLVASKNTVMTGRDIGSEIFPDAKNKFYLTASVETRAERRFKQLVSKDASVNKFSSSKIKYEDVLVDMNERDSRDTTREISPLRIPEGAVVIDNSHLTVEQTVEEMLKHIHV